MFQGAFAGVLEVLTRSNWYLCAPSLVIRIHMRNTLGLPLPTNARHATLRPEGISSTEMCARFSTHVGQESRSIYR